MKKLLALFALPVAACTSSSAPTPAPAASQAEDPTALMARLDTNHDGKLTADELAGGGERAHELASHLADLDLDGDGALDADELAQHHADMAAIFADHGAGLFAQYDSNNDGKLSPSELQGAPFPASMLMVHLAEVDSDGDGMISRAELAAVIDKHHGR